MQGRYNIEDTKNKYAHIVGNGNSYDNNSVIRSNAHTLDWDGNAWFSGNVTDGSGNSLSGLKTQIDAEAGKINTKTGKIVAGTVYTIDGVSVTASDGAETFNNYNANIATGLFSHAEGNGTKAIGSNSHAEGENTTANKIAIKNCYKNEQYD